MYYTFFLTFCERFKLFGVVLKLLTFLFLERNSKNIQNCRKNFNHGTIQGHLRNQYFQISCAWKIGACFLLEKVFSECNQKRNKAPL